LEVDGVRGLVRGGDGDENSSRIKEGVDSQSRIKSKGTATETATGTGTGRTSPEESKVGYEWLDGGIAGSVLGAVISGFSKQLHLYTEIPIPFSLLNSSPPFPPSYLNPPN
jgi:hypothetical protein